MSGFAPREEFSSDIASLYRPLADAYDEMMDGRGNIRPHWQSLLADFARLGANELDRRFAIADRHLRESGVFYRVQDDTTGTERPWPLSHIPLCLPAGEWHQLEAGLVQRARLLEKVLDDLYGPQHLVRDGLIPAALVAGNPEFFRPLQDVAVRGGHRLQVLAIDLGRGPDGRWWVLGDRTQAPSGSGYALENRIALSRALPDLYRSRHVERLAGWFDRFRTSLAGLSGQESTRIGLLSPGPMSDTYFEHAYLARYLGFLLVEGADLIVRDGAVHVRTIEGLKRADVLLRRLDADFADPLELNPASRLGVPGLVQAVRAQKVVLANSLGSGVLEARALLGFLPALAEELLGEPLLVPNIATWWCGQPVEREAVLANLGQMVLAPALGAQIPGLLDFGAAFGSSLTPEQRAGLEEAVRLRGMDFVGQEIVRLSTMPVWENGQLRPRPFTLRVFLTRTAQGWSVMPGGFCRVSDVTDARALSMRDGARSADVWVLSERPVPAKSLLPVPNEAPVQRTIGYLTSRAADNLFWLGRYIERAEMTLRVARAVAVRLFETGEAAADARTTIFVLTGLLKTSGALPAEADVASGFDLIATALHDRSQPGSVSALAGEARRTASVIRDRLSPDAWRALNLLASSLGGGGPFNDALGEIEHALRLVAAFSGLAQENMNRLAGWRFLELGRRIERAQKTCGFVRALAGHNARQDALDAALELADSVLTYRMRYLMGASRPAIVDLTLLDPGNPRSAAFQLDRIVEHLNALPQARSDGLPDAARRIGARVQADLRTAQAREMDGMAIMIAGTGLIQLSDEITLAYFTHPGLPTDSRGAA